MQRFFRQLLLCFLILLCQAAPAVSQTSSKPPQANAAGYTGSLVCRTCHPDVWMNWYKNPHFKQMAGGEKLPENEAALGAHQSLNLGCESCHGPGRKHVEAKGGKATIRAFSVMEPKQVLNACLGCHSKDLTRSNIQRSSHSLADVACNSCHSIHKSPTQKALLAKKQTDLCYSCHTQVRAQFSMPVKHRVNEGFMNCSDCHNPHGAPAPTWRMGARPRMVDHALGNEQPCVKCHMDKRGPFAFEHAAVRVDGCESCHVPHGSMNARLLKRPVVFTLCLECHNGAGNFGRQGDGIELQSRSHNMADPKYQNCTTCHVRIHGSNADERFLR